MNNNERPQLIDIHHHIFPPGYAESAGNGRLYAQSGGNSASVVKGWTPQKSLDEMDRCGIEAAVTSITTPGTWFGDVEGARRLSRDCNEYGARLARDYPGRFGTLASLALPDVEGSLREIEYALDVLEVDGFILMTSYDNRWPGEQEFAPVFDELNLRKAVVFFHPTAPDCCRGLITDVIDTTLEYMFDTVRAITSLLYSGTLTRCPDIRFIFAHNGSAVSLLKNRIAALWNTKPKFAERLPNGPIHELQKLYYETAGSALPECLSPLSQLVSCRNILFGTDYPLGRITVSQTVSGLHEYGFPQSDVRMVEAENALRLFPNLKRCMPAPA